MKQIKWLRYLLVFSSIMIFGYVYSESKSNDIEKGENVNHVKEVVFIQVLSLNFELEDILDEKLIGLVINDDEQETIPYQKFSLDISSYCYSCDLASVLIKEKKVVIENYCSLDYHDKIEFVKQEKKHDLVFVFEKIEKDVYQLTIEGHLETELKINSYYTTEGSLPKFKIHDCGDFEG